MIQNFAFLNQQGFIPGPQETEEAFYERVKFCQDLLFHLNQESNEELPFQAKDQASKEILEETFDLTQRLYGIQPNWVPLFFSNYQLSFWHGGCAWIFQLNDHSPLAAFLQLRAHFQYSSTYLKFYHRKELIAHELSHVGRLMLDDPQFEEFFAYQSSPYRWRRWLGPLVQSSTESLIFILLLGFITLVDLAVLYNHQTNFLNVTHGLKLIPLILISLAFIRLTIRHWIYHRCLKQLTIGLKDSSQARHLLYRLSDGEIRQFAKKSPEEIKKLMTALIPLSFRWKFLNQLYPFSAN